MRAVDLERRPTVPASSFSAMHKLKKKPLFSHARRALRVPSSYKYQLNIKTAVDTTTQATLRMPFLPLLVPIIYE